MAPHQTNPRTSPETHKAEGWESMTSKATRRARKRNMW
jgi:hypothetical protein